MNKLTLNKSISRNGGPWGSISRVFSRASKQRKTLDLSIYEGKNIIYGDTYIFRRRRRCMFFKIPRPI
jgi:hypothetical protein